MDKSLRLTVLVHPVYMHTRTRFRHAVKNVDRMVPAVPDLIVNETLRRSSYQSWKQCKAIASISKHYVGYVAYLELY